MREGFARPFVWRVMMADLEEDGLVLRAGCVLGAGWRREEGPLSEVEIISEFQSSVISRLLLAMRQIDDRCCLPGFHVAGLRWACE